jgi:hypothetical protein
VIIAALALLSAVVVITAFWRYPNAIPEMLRVMFEMNLFARIIRLLLIVSAIVALGLTDRVDDNAAIAALASIAGYVLGAAGSIRPPPPKTAVSSAICG